MRIRAAVSLMIVLSMLTPVFGQAPGTATQGTAAPPPAPPGGAEIDTVPADAIVLTVRECIQQTLEKNLQIAISRYAPDVAESNIGIPEAVFDPTASGSVYYQDETRTDPFQSAIGTTTSLTTSTVSAVAASWLDPLTFGGSYRIDLEATGVDGDFDPDIDTTLLASEPFKNYTTRWQFTYRQSLLRNFGKDVNIFPVVVARNNLGISAAQFHQVVLDTVAIAISDYADLNFAIMQLRTARFSLKLAQDFLEQNRIKVRVGTLAPIEITQAEAQVADREELVIIAEAGLRNAEDRIRADIGMRKDSPEWSRPVRPSDPLTLEEFEPTEETALEAAFTNRPDLEQARLDLESRETEVHARENLKRWGLDFEGTYGNRGFSAYTYNPFTVDPEIHGSYSDAYDDLQDRNQTTWSAGLFLSVPIFNRLAASNYRIAASNLGQSQHQLAQVEQVARLEVRSGVRAVETNLKRVKASQVNVRLQREKLEAEQKKFENGMSTSFQVLQFQDDLSNSETRENLSKVDYNKALVELERVKGTLLERFGVALEKGTPGGSAGGDRSASLRTLWRRPAGPPQDSGLRLGERTTDGLRLPTDFVYEAPRESGSAGL
jgi:outer membrane protein TolC